MAEDGRTKGLVENIDRMIELLQGKGVGKEHIKSLEYLRSKYQTEDEGAS